MNTTTKSYNHNCQNCGSEFTAPYTPAAVAKGQIIPICTAMDCMLAGTKIHNEAIFAARAASKAARASRPVRVSQPALVDGGGIYALGLMLGQKVR